MSFDRFGLLKSVGRSFAFCINYNIHDFRNLQRLLNFQITQVSVCLSVERLLPAQSHQRLAMVDLFGIFISVD